MSHLSTRRAQYEPLGSARKLPGQSLQNKILSAALSGKCRDDNPLMDTRKYKVECSDGSTAEYFANIIAENIFSQVWRGHASAVISMSRENLEND